MMREASVLSIKPKSQKSTARLPKSLAEQVRPDVPNVLLFSPMIGVIICPRHLSASVFNEWVMYNSGNQPKKNPCKGNGDR
jgi:hypothetical protein